MHYSDFRLPSTGHVDFLHPIDLDGAGGRNEKELNTRWTAILTKTQVSPNEERNISSECTVNPIPVL